MKIPSAVRTLAIILTLHLSPFALGENTTDPFGKALELVHQVENPAGNPPTDVQQIDLLTQAMELTREAPNHRLKGHRVSAIQAIRSALAELRKGDPNHLAATYLHTADIELSASISLAEADQPSVNGQAPAASAGPSSTSLTSDDYVNQGTARMKQGDWNGGMSDYDQAIKLDPKNIKAYLKRSFARQGRDPQGAIADLNQVIVLDSTNVEAYEERADIKRMHQDYDGAITDYDHLIALKPKDWSYYGIRAMTKEAKGDLEGALTDYNQDILLEPTDFNAFHNRACLKRRQGDLNGALADLSQAIALGMHDAYVYRERADIKKALGDLDGALADYDQVIGLSSKGDGSFVNFDEVYLQRGDIKLVRRDLTGAIADYNQSIQLHAEETPGAYFSIWTAQMLQNKKADADSLLSSEMSKNTGFTWYWPTNVSEFLLGQMSESDFMNTAAATDAKKEALQQCQAWYYAGIKHLLAGDGSTAADDFQKCLATNQKDLRTYFLAQAELHAMAKKP